jgi:uncharacterized protein YbcI
MSTDTTQDGPPGDQSIAMETSNEMVKLYKALFGRGPTKARTNFAGPNTLIVTLEDSLTQSEKNLARLDEHQRLRDMRTFFQHSSESDFVTLVERTTGRTVRAFVSGIDTKRDVSSEVFYFEPLAEPASAS